MKKAIFIIFATISISVYGQTHFFGVRAGFALTDISSDNSKIDTDSKFGFSGGLTYDYLMGDRFSIGADAIFNQQGFTNNFAVEDGFGNPTGRIIVSKFEYDYLSFPIRLGTYFGKKTFGVGQIGVVPSFLLETKTTPGSDHPVMPFPVTKIDFAGFVELGAGYKLNRFWLALSTTYQRSFTTFRNVDYFGDTQIRHKGLTFSFTLKYRLSKHNNRQQ